MLPSFSPIYKPGKTALIANGVTIVTEGSAVLGFGHIRRSITLARLLQPRAPVRLWILSPSAEMDAAMREHFIGLDVGVGPCPDHLSSVEILDLDPEAMRGQLLHSGSKAKRLCLDWFDPAILPDMTINLIDHGGLMREAYRGAGRRHAYLEGPDFAIIRPSLRALRPAQAVLVPEVRHIVITPGGADPARQTLAALAGLAQQAALPEHITVIIGPLASAGYEAEILAAAPASCRVLRAPTDYEDIVASADVVLCSGGGTLLENMCLAKPVVVYPQNAAEENHASSHARAGACVMASSLSAVLASAELRSSLVARAHRLVDGQGAERIAEAALELLR